MPRLLDPLLLPQRLTERALGDLQRLADAAASVGALAGELRQALPRATASARELVATVQSARDQLVMLRQSLEPMSDDLDAVRRAFAETSEQLEQLRTGVVPRLAGVQTGTEGLHEEVRRQRELIDALNSQIESMGGTLAGEITALRETFKPLIRDADEIREVLEPLEGATERLGHLAERLPGPGRKLLPKTPQSPKAPRDRSDS